MVGVESIFCVIGVDHFSGRRQLRYTKNTGRCDSRFIGCAGDY